MEKDAVKLVLHATLVYNECISSHISIHLLLWLYALFSLN